MQQQAAELARRPHVVIATPGRLQVRPPYGPQRQDGLCQYATLNRCLEGQI
jgi:hypothetical protein